MVCLDLEDLMDVDKRPVASDERKFLDLCRRCMHLEGYYRLECLDIQIITYLVIIHL